MHLKRPMLWFALFFLGGELMGLAGGSVWQAALFTSVCIWITGSRKSYFRVTWIRLMLPVFFLSGFVVLRAAMAAAEPDPVLLQSGTVTFSGKIEEVSEKANSYAVTIEDANVDSMKAGLMIYADKDTGSTLYAGDFITGTGHIEKPPCASNPGQFDMRRYLASKNIAYILFPETLRVTAGASAFRKAVEDLRRDVRTVFETLFDDRQAGLLKAMLLGDSAGLEDDMRDMYRLFGIAHILAISGMHLSLIGGGLYRFLKIAGMPQRPAALTAAFSVMSYARFVHAGPATMRAVIMFMVLMAGEYMGRRYDGLSALGFSFLIIMIRYPLAITQPGLQYALAAMLALYLVLPACDRLLKIPRKGRGRRMFSWIGAPAAVMLTTMPLAAYYYGEIPLLSLPANLIAALFIGPVMTLGLLTGGLGLFYLKPAAFLAGSLKALLNAGMLIQMLRPLRAYLSVRTGSQLPAVIVFWYIVLGVFVVLTLRMGCRDKRLLLMLLCVLIVFVPFRRLGPVAAFLDVGQGDCAFVRFENGMTMLSDGGSSDVKEVGIYRIIPFLDYYGAGTVDMAFVSHADADHYSGILELIEAGRIRHLILAEAGKEDEGYVILAEAAKANGTELTYAAAGDAWAFGDEKVSCIYPAADEKTADTNDRSLVLHISCRHLDMLLTGDVSSEAERKLLGRPDLRADILKAAHHGSRYSTCEEFLDAVSPGGCVISAGEKNRYGHPHEEVLSRIRGSGAGIWSTKANGAVLIDPGKDHLDIRSFCPEGK